MYALAEKQNVLPLPAGYTARGGTLEDYKIAFDLLNIYSQHLNGCDDLLDPELLRIDWLNDGFKPETDIRMIFAPDNTLVALSECWQTHEPPVHPWMFSVVHPDHWGRGIGSHLVTWAEDRASAAMEKCAPELRVAPRTGTLAHNKAGKELLERLGWKHIRSYYRMVTDLDSAPEVPPLPVGITIRPYNPGTETEAVYLTLTESFKDHFGVVTPPFEKGFAEFKHNFIEEPGYDPRFWFVAMDGEEMAGISICRRVDAEDPECGWVAELGVLRPWRKRGVGYALLKHSFAAFYADGRKRAGLGVDSQNLTGALRLYERAGMRVQRQYDQYEKELRPGIELSTETLST
jgi:GNAT superfamily N-acetyltransferase